MKKNVVLCLLALCLFALAAMPATASSFVALSENQLVAQSNTIVQGTVVDVRSSWTESGRLIATDAKVRVAETLRGNAAEFITVRTFGGEVGGIRVEAHGFPMFEKGREVILFLDRGLDKSGRYSVVGYQQGHYRVVKRLDGVTLAVPQVDAGMRFIDPYGKAAPVQKSVEIGAFKSALAQHIDRLGSLDK